MRCRPVPGPPTETLGQPRGLCFLLCVLRRVPSAPGVLWEVVSGVDKVCVMQSVRDTEKEAVTQRAPSACPQLQTLSLPLPVCSRVPVTACPSRASGVTLNSLPPTRPTPALRTVPWCHQVPGCVPVCPYLSHTRLLPAWPRSGSRLGHVFSVSFEFFAAPPPPICGENS